eukprot:358741-Prymnesium_polylepis.1
MIRNAHSARPQRSAVTETKSQSDESERADKKIHTISCQGEHRGREFVIAQSARVIRVVLLEQRLRLVRRDPYAELVAECEKLVHVEPVGRVLVKLVEDFLQHLSLVAAAVEERVDD